MKIFSCTSRINYILTGLAILASVIACVEEFTPEINNYSKVIVIDALLVNNNKPITVKLSYTYRENGEEKESISGAEIYVTDKDNNIVYLVDVGKGQYISPENTFNGRIGNTYQLTVNTPNGKTYQSDWCKMFSVPKIDSVHYKSAERISDDGTEVEKGVEFSINSSSLQDSTNYLRWGYEEFWEYRTFYSSILKRVNDTVYNWEDYDSPEICWKSAESNSILVQSFVSQNNKDVKDKAIHFVIPGSSDRFVWQYAFIAKQYSVSEQEYNFWDNLKDLSERTGDIFEKQPYAIKGNISCVTNNEELVVGYFSVSAIAEKLTYLIADDLQYLGFFKDTYSCDSYYEIEPQDVPFETKKNEIYLINTNNGSNVVRVLYDPISSAEIGFGFANEQCLDCRLNASDNRPEFWHQKYQ